MARTVVEEVVAEFKGDTRGIEAATKRANKSIDNFAGKTQSASASMRNSFNSIGVALAAAFSAVKFTNIADEFTLLRARIENATRSQQEFNDAFSGLKQIARDTGADIGAAVDVFQRISFVRDEINATTADMLNFTETVSKLGVISGASTGALKAGLTQLGQSLSSGIVRAEEFNSIMENIPAVGVRIAEEFGVTTGQLRQLVVEGEVLSQDVFQAILNQSEKVRAEFEAYPKTVGRAFQNLKIRLFEAVDGINEGTKATGILIGAMEIVGKAISALAKVIEGWANVFSAMFDVVAAGMVDAFAKGTRAIESGVNFAISALNRLRGEADQIKPVDFGIDVNTSALAQDALENARRNIKEAGEAFEGAFENVESLFQKGEQGIRQQSSAVKELSQDYQEIIKNLKTNTESNKEAEKAARAASKAEEERLSRVKQRAEEYADSLKAIREQAIRNKNEMSDFIFNASQGFESLRDIAVQALQDIARNIFRVLQGGRADGGLLGGIGGAIGGLLGGIGGGAFGLQGYSAAAGNRSLFQVAGSAASGAYGPGFASGGMIMENGRTGGPDNQTVMFRKSPNERVSITRPGQSASIGGGNQTIVNQSINVSTGVQQTVRAEMTRMLPQIRRESVAAVEDALSRSKLKG